MHTSNKAFVCIVKGYCMPFTIEKLQHRVADLERAAHGPHIVLTSIRVAPASGPMTAPPDATDEHWQAVESGQLWGIAHGTSWLRASLRVSQELVGQPVVLQLHWGPGEFDLRQWIRDPLLVRLEATVFLDGKTIGAFDWRHPVLLLPSIACDGQAHELTLQVYTRHPLPFGGLTLSRRDETIWQLSVLMQTALEAILTLDENSVTRHTILERLNAAYNMLDLREGWHGSLFANSALSVLSYLRKHLAEHLNSGNRPGITVTGHAHQDLAWHWPYWRTHQKIAHTVANVLSLMERYPFYHYSQSQPQALQWLKEDMPAIYARVKERVAEGRFEPVGAMWVEADCNLTSGESLIRQILHGTHFTQQEFGITPRCIWLPDVFGYSAALPQIMRGCDIPVFMTTKISWNQFNRMPCDTFRWRGIDGSEVLTHFVTAPDEGKSIYYTYNGPLRAADMPGTWQNYRQQEINDQLLYLCGWGDGGGGPTEVMLERVPTLANLPDFPSVQMGRAADYFTSLYERVWDNPRLPRWVGELYLEYHRGTYTSQARTKQANRRAELFYREVELLNSWASLYGMPSRQEQLNEGWKSILLNQFHDVLPGSSIHEVYEDAARLYAEARALGEQIRDESLLFLGRHLGWNEQDLVLINTLPWERTDPQQLPSEAAALLGNEIDRQTVADWDGNQHVLVDGLPIPACGASVLATEVDAGRELEGSCRAMRGEDGSIVLSNVYYELTLDTNGEISRLYDKRAERDVLLPGQTGNQLIAYEDRPLNYDAWDIDLFYEEKPYPLRQVRHMHLIEEGPVRVTVEIERGYMASRVTQRISLWRSSPRIDIATEIEWHEHQTVLKAAFPVDINSAVATYEIQFGNVQRPTHRNTSWDLARFEVCAHRWVDLSEGDYGVSLLNDSKYGHDIHDNVMRLTLLKSGIVPDPEADQGLHRFTYSLLPHQGGWREAETVRRAYELNAPVLAITSRTGAARAERSHGTEHSFLRSDCPNVLIETVKPAEDGDGLIVRLYETHNARAQGTITFASIIASAQECNLLEEAKDQATYEGNTLHFQVRPFEIKTFRVRLKMA
jgi:alpha-mannosidase